MKKFLDTIHGHRTWLLVAFVLVAFTVTGIVLAFTKDANYYTTTLDFLGEVIVSSGVTLGVSKLGGAAKMYADGKAKQGAKQANSE